MAFLPLISLFAERRMRMKAAIYARFSSDRQQETSIEAQVRACNEYAQRKKINVIKVFADEAISGTTTKRPQYQAMLAEASAHKFDIVLIHKYDRIARDLSEHVKLEDRFNEWGIKLIAVAQDFGESKEARVSKGIQWIMSDYYIANLAEETRKGCREIALKGLHNGGVAPFGYYIENQQYLINDYEAHFVQEMFDCCINGGKYKDLINKMESCGIVGHRGKPIGYTQIYEILRNEKYTGTYVYSPVEEKDRALRRTKPNAIRIENAFPAIIDKETYERAQAVLAKHQHTGRMVHPCSGLVYCSCGAKMHMAPSRKNGHEYFSFRCSAHCGQKGARANVIEDAVMAFLDQVFKPENIAGYEKTLKTLKKEAKIYEADFEKARRDQLRKCDEEISNLLELIKLGKLSPDNYELIDAELSRLRQEKVNIQNLEPEQPISIAQINTWLKEIKKSEKTPRAFINRIEWEGDSGSVKVISTFTEVAESCQLSPRNHIEWM